MRANPQCNRCLAGELIVISAESRPAEGANDELLRCSQCGREQRRQVDAPLVAPTPAIAAKPKRPTAAKPKAKPKAAALKRRTR